VKHDILITGDVNLMNVTDPAVPFRQVGPVLRKANIAFSNLECCLYDPPGDHAVEREGFWASCDAGGRALLESGVAAVGNANNVNYGADAIRSSNKRLDELGIPHCGTGNNVEQARRPVIVERGGVRYGFLQRTSVYWATDHEAGPASTGVAVIKGETAYQVPLHKTRPEIPPFNRPGLPPIVVTWADRDSLARFSEDVAALRKQCDVLVASCHWGLDEEVLDYMTQIAHAAIDAGADVVVGHGPHYSLPVGYHRGKPIYYGLGSFSFHTGHGGRKHGDWVGMLASVQFTDRAIDRASFRFVRHNDANETVLRSAADEQAMFDSLAERSVRYGARLARQGDDAVFVPVA
jgi:poly-gamma-glutamate capsule biosynthesis protein CapA/YwtB (metallophosphatase superfamily)